MPQKDCRSQKRGRRECLEPSKKLGHWVWPTGLVAFGPHSLYRAASPWRVASQHYGQAAWDTKAKEALVSHVVILPFLSQGSYTLQWGCQSAPRFLTRDLGWVLSSISQGRGKGKHIAWMKQQVGVDSQIKMPGFETWLYHILAVLHEQET